MDRHHRQAGDAAARPEAPGPRRRRRCRRCRRCRRRRRPRGRRLREDGADPRPRGRDRLGPRDGTGAQAVVPAVLQASLLPRRVPAGLQPPERVPGGHRRPRRRPDHRVGRGRRRTRVRARLRHLRHRLRGGRALHEPGWLRRRRVTGPQPVVVLGRLDALPARHAWARVPEPVRPRPRAGRVHGQLPAPPRRVEPPRGPSREARPRPRHRRGRGDRRSRGRLARHPGRAGSRPPGLPGAVHALLLRQRGPARRRRVRDQLVRRGPLAFFSLLAEWRADGRSAGLQLRARSPGDA